jgi:hypothetical protein
MTLKGLHPNYNSTHAIPTPIKPSATPRQVRP